VAKKVLKNVVGFDLNPIAVIAARTTYLLALGNLRRAISPITIPVYMCDSILTPTEYATLFGKGHKIPTTVGEFLVPKEVVDKGALDSLATLVEECVHDYSTDEFIERVHRVMGIEENGTETALRDLFEQVKGLEEEGRNRIWARILKNAFAPIFQEKFDYVVGNPPWVNWESLSDEYREATKPLWVDYGLFSLKGWRARLGGGKKDLAALFAYACIDNYLKDKGKLGFVITQTLFKTKGAGAGFRRFKLGEDGADLRVLHVDDMVALKPFEGAANRTSVVVMQRKAVTRYPVPYTLWKRKERASIGLDSSLDEVIEATHRAKFAGHPIDAEDLTSPWITARKRVISVAQTAIGESPYKAHAGACTWADGVYWLEIIERRKDGLLVVENLWEGRRKKVKRVRHAIEPDLVHPLLRGQDARRWHAKARAHILVVQDPNKRTGYEESWLKLNLPHTYAYLKQFESLLKQRSGFKKYFNAQKDAFYSMYNIGPYTFAPFKVVWSGLGVSSNIQAAMTEAIVPANTLTFAAFGNRSEALYFCGVINSTIIRFIVASIYVGGSPYVLEHIAIPKYDPQNPLHLELSALSQRAHELAAKGEKEALKEVEEEIDRKAAELWGITKADLKEIKRSLEELG